MSPFLGFASHGSGLLGVAAPGCLRYPASIFVMQLCTLKHLSSSYTAGLTSVLQQVFAIRTHDSIYFPFYADFFCPLSFPRKLAATGFFFVI